jgi:uncharacterized protein
MELVNEFRVPVSVDQAWEVLTTDLTISGKAAQFGRGVLSDVATKLIGQFAERLEADVLAGSVATPATEAAQPQTVSAPTADDAASVDLLGVLAVPVAKRAAPVAAGLAAGLAIGWLIGHRSNNNSRA